MMKVKLSTALLLSLFLVPGLFALDVIKGGKSRCAVVLGKNATPVEKFAASEFVSLLKEKTGAVIPVGETLPKGYFPIYLRFRDGKNDASFPAHLRKRFASLKWDGYLYEATPKSLWVIGNTDQALHHGNYYLLKTFGKIRFLHPDEPAVIPKSRDFSIPNALKVRNPYFREIIPAGRCGHAAPEHRILWRIRNGATVTTRPPRHTRNRPQLLSFYAKIGDRYSGGGHCFTPLLVGSWARRDMVKLYKEHPEFFGLRKGKRIMPDLSLTNKDQLCQPCLSNPEVKRRIAANLSKELVNVYENKPVTYRIYNDDHMFWCECKNCSRLDDPKAGPNGKNSNRYWDLVNYLADTLLKKHPNLTLLAIAYQNYRDVPTKVKPAKNVLVQIAPHGDCYAHVLSDPDCPTNGKYLKMFMDWKKLGKELYVFEYHNQLPGASRYIPVERTWVKFLKFYNTIGVRSANCVICDGETPHTNQPYYSTYNYKNSWYSRWQQAYLTGYFAWDLHDDYDKVWNEINSLYYGKAWKYIKPYRLMLEKEIKDAGICFGYGTSANTTLGKVYERPNVAKRAGTFLAQAEKAVENDPLYLKRILREKEYFKKNFQEAGFSSMRESSVSFQVPRSTVPIKIDGILEDKEWVKALLLPDLTVPPRTTASKPFLADPRTQIRILYDKDNCYFGIKAFKGKRGEIHKAKANGLRSLTGSHIEFALMSEFLEGKYYHIGFTLNNFSYSALTSDGKTRDLKKTLPFQYKIRDGKDAWTAEVKIPVFLLGGLKNGTAWKINIMRSAPDAKGRMQNGLLSKTHFHMTTNFPVFIFGQGGNLLLNGDFKNAVKMEPPKAPRNKKEFRWVFTTEKMPAFWRFLPGNPGVAGLFKEGNESFLKIAVGKSKYPFLWQILRTDDSGAKKYLLSCKLRGKGIISPTIRYDLNRKTVRGKNMNVNSAQWKTYTQVFDVSKIPGSARSLFFLMQGKEVDIKDVKVIPQEEEVMPEMNR